MKNNGPITHAYEIYRLTVMDSTKEVSSILSDSVMMLMRINDSAKDIIYILTRCIVINCKGTSTIGVARPYQLVGHLCKITIFHPRIYRIKVKSRTILKLEGDYGEIRFLNIRKR